MNSECQVSTPTAREIQVLLASVAAVPALEYTHVLRFDSDRIVQALEQLQARGGTGKPSAISPVDHAVRGVESNRSRPLKIRTLASRFEQPSHEILLRKTHVAATNPSSSWYWRHVRVRHSTQRATIVIEQLCTMFSNNRELIAKLIGAPNAEAVRNAISPAAHYIPISEAVGVSAIRAASKIKHQLNELLIISADYSGTLVALELGQGAGDGTQIYQKHGWVVSVENDDDHLAVASGRIHHLNIPTKTLADPASNPLNSITT
jgi:hypothetical protein